jgi:hypothetical protein
MSLPAGRGPGWEVAEMSDFPCLVRFVSGSGQVRYRLGDRLVDRYLEFVAGRCRPNTLRAVAFDLKAFFTVVRTARVEVTAAQVFDFLADQRGDRTVVRLTGSRGCRRGRSPAACRRCRGCMPTWSREGIRRCRSTRCRVA